jgi:hypothetical protein
MRLKSRTRTSNSYTFIAGTAWATALPSNQARQVLFLQGVGGSIVNIAFNTNQMGAGVSVPNLPGLTYGGSASAIQLGSAATLIIEQHVGPIFMNTATGLATVSLNELVESGSAAITFGNKSSYYGGASALVFGNGYPGQVGS